MAGELTASSNKSRNKKSSKGQKIFPIKKENKIKHVLKKKTNKNNTKRNNENKKSTLKIGTVLPINTIKALSIDIHNKQINVSIHVPNEEGNNTLHLNNGRILFNQIDEFDDYNYDNFNDIMNSTNIHHQHNNTKFNYKLEDIEKLFPINKYIQKVGVVIHTTIISEPQQHNNYKRIICISLRSSLLSKIKRSIDIEKQLSSESSKSEVFCLNVGTILPSNALTITKVNKWKIYVTFTSAYSDQKHKGRIDIKQITDDIKNNTTEDLKDVYKEGQVLPNQGIILSYNGKKREEEYRISLRPSFVFAGKYNIPGYMPTDYFRINMGDVVIGWIIDHEENDSTKVHFCNFLIGWIAPQYNEIGRNLPLHSAVCCQVIELDTSKFRNEKIILKYLDV